MKLQQAEKGKTAISDSDTECPIAKKYTHTKNLHEWDTKDICFLLDFIRIRTTPWSINFQVDTQVCNYCHVLQDEWLLAKLSAGGLIAQDAKHHRCLASLYNKAAAVEDKF